MRTLTLLFIFISSSALCQFTMIWNIPSNFSGIEVRAFDMNDSGQLLLISRQYDGGPISNLMAYSSTDNGITWDSTLMHNHAMMKDNAVITHGGKMYFATIQNVYPTLGSPYQRKVMHSSLDAGNTWTEKTIDSLIVGSNFSRSLEFLNDSTGMYFYQKGKFLTTDYGETWQKISSNGAEHLGQLDDRFIFYWYQSAKTVNPFTSQIDSISYEPFCEGNVDQSFFYDGTAYRMIHGQNGQNMGPQYNGNYAGFNIDELPLGDQRVIHFPQNSSLIDIHATESCIHLVLSGRYARSCDGGDTFHFVDAFNGNMNEQVHEIEFINDTLGYLVTQNLITYTWHLWKTTNGGGSDLEEVLTNQSMTGVNEIESELGIIIYPNPARDAITAESEVEITLIELYSMDGKLIVSKRANSKKVTLNLRSISSGNYLLKSETGSGTAHSRIAIE